MGGRTGTGPYLVPGGQAEPEAPPKAVAMEGLGRSPRSTGQWRVRGAAAASPLLHKNPNPPQLQQCWHHQTSSSSRNTSPASNHSTVLPGPQGTRWAQWAQDRLFSTSPFPCSLPRSWCPETLVIWIQRQHPSPWSPRPAEPHSQLSPHTWTPPGSSSTSERKQNLCYCISY